MDTDNGITDATPLVDFASKVEDKSKNIIKVVGVGGGGCNAVGNMYKEGIVNVTFAVCNTDTQALAKSEVPVKIPLGELGAGGDPSVGLEEARKHTDEIKQMLSDGTKMVFVTAGMGGGTGTGAAPFIAGIAKSMDLLTIGVVTIPFFFEKRLKIIKALKGVEEMRKTRQKKDAEDALIDSYYGKGGNNKERPQVRCFIFGNDDLDNDNLISAIESMPTYSRSRTQNNELIKLSKGDVDSVSQTKVGTTTSGTIKFA